MLKIFNNLKPFFENNYRKINVREYARIMNISPPSASKILKGFEKERLLKKKEERGYKDYMTDRESLAFIKLSQAYWTEEFKRIRLVDYLEKELINPLLIIFGSLSKAEINDKSDIDMAIFTISKKKINLIEFEKRLGKKIQIFQFKDRGDVKSKELLNNILNGFIIMGGW